MVTGFMIHWDPSQKFHFDLKCVKIPFLASGAHCFGKESQTCFVFWILWYWLTSEDAKCVPIICRIQACYNILWNSTPSCFLIFTEYTPLPILHHWQHETHPKSVTVFYTSHGHGQNQCSLGIGKKERGRLVLVCMEPSCQVKELCPLGPWSPCWSAWLGEHRVGPHSPPELSPLGQDTAS